MLQILNFTFLNRGCYNVCLVYIIKIKQTNSWLYTSFFLCANFRKAPSLRDTITHIPYTLATMQNAVFCKNPDIDTSTSICAGHGEPERRGDRVQRAPRGERRRQRGGLGDQLPHLLHEAPGGGLIISGKTLRGKSLSKLTLLPRRKIFFFPRTVHTASILGIIER